MRVKDAVGRHGEELAARHLEAAGLQILARNWRCRAGELDIVARDAGALVFVEVKTRSSLACGAPAEAVSPTKAARIRQLAMQWVAAQRAEGELAAWSTLRFDVVSVLRQHGRFEVTHLKGAF
jgi:putative endonuclease